MLVFLGIDPKNALDSLIAMNTIDDKHNESIDDTQFLTNLPDIGEDIDAEVVKSSEK